MKRGKDLTISAKEEIIGMNRIEKRSPKKIAEKRGLWLNTVKTIIRKANKAERDGDVPVHRGRPLTDESNAELLIKRLKMENQLLRDFLQFTGSEAANQISCDLSTS